ncbi:homogentisate 1,2-dioxygenase [bacterium]|nr:homogentisate 1,2-dioxygenase [bacterium]
MKEWVRFQKQDGITSRQAHCDLPEGTYEREFGREGFFGPTSHLYHTHKPTGWVGFDGPLKPRAFDYTRHGKPTSSPWDAVPILGNSALRFRFWSTSGKMDHLVSNGDGDDLLFVHRGEGDFYCDFGHMRFREGDYILLPRGLMWRVECTGEASFLLMEATNDGYRLPVKGAVGPHAIFDPAIMDVPSLNDTFQAQKHERETVVVIKKRNLLTRLTYPFNPLDAIGWKGDNLPVRINWRDIRPLMSHRYHLPPSAHTTFLCSRFVVCTFVPRPMETDPGALKIPFFHSNNDYDEIIFYHMGEFFSRDNIHPGMITLHPCGFAHGPHPKAFKAGAGQTHAKKETDEVAVMIDTRDAVEVAPEATEVEWDGYAGSWRE